MDAKTYPLQDILKPERRYLIPTFQRDYEWTRDGQWKLMFEDLASTADRLLEVRLSGKRGTSLSQGEQSVSPHFLGAIVCAGLPFSSGGVALRSVIDGQQRLTTVELLIRGLADALIEAKSERTQTVKRMLFNPKDVVESPDEVYKLWPRRRDRDMWRLAMADEAPAEGQVPSHPYLEARSFFAAEARRYASINESGELDTGRLVALADALASLFKLVVIDLDDNDDAQVIFEVLNGRQTPLAAIDLVKNLLFLRGEFDDDDVDRLYDQYWARFDSEWWRQDVGRGHAQRGRRDALLAAWLTAETGNETNVGHLYREAREYLSEGPATEDVLRQLNAYADAYQVIYEARPVDDDRLRAAYRNLRALEITTADPVLAWLRTLPTESLPGPVHVRAVRAIESWALRRAYVGSQTRGYGTYLARALRAGRAATEAGADVADALIEALRSGPLGWPTDSEVRNAFAQHRFYGGMSQLRIRLLLGELDALMRSENASEPPAWIEYDQLQIEHVMPQAWATHWPLDAMSASNPADPAGNAAEVLAQRQQRDLAIDRIGNLTLVTGSFNRDVSNLSWAVKRTEFAKQRSLVINYAVAQAPEWDEQSIQERAQELASAAVRRWPSSEVLRSAPSG